MLIQNVNRPSTAAFIKRPDLTSSKSVRKTNYLNVKSQLTKLYCMKTISQLIKQKEKSTHNSIHKSHQNISSYQNSIHQYRSPQSRLYVSQKKIVEKKDNFNSNSNKFYQNFKKNLIQRNPNLKAKVRHSLLIQNKDKNKICQFISQNIKLQAFASDQNNFLPYNCQKNSQLYKQKCEQWINNHKKMKKQSNQHIKQRSNLQRRSQKNSENCLQKQNKFFNSFDQIKNNIYQNSQKNAGNYKKNFLSSSILYKNSQRQLSQIYKKKNSSLTQHNFYKKSEPFQVFIIDEWKDPQQQSLSRLMA